MSEPVYSTFQLLTGMELYPRSVVQAGETTYFLVRNTEAAGERLLGVVGNPSGFYGRRVNQVFFCPLSPENADVLRGRLAWLRPQPLGLHKSAGCGDRLGSATPGHIRALRRVAGIAPILAQQSIRENARTGRTPQQVMDDAMWGVFQEGWRAPWGADADHLKTPADVDACAAAGYTFFTVDPGDHVDNGAHSAALDVLERKVGALPWAELDDSPEALRGRYLGRRFAIHPAAPGSAGPLVLEFDEAGLLRAACKYGRAILHAARMHRHLADRMGERPFELEVSVDETETPTSPLEHLFIATELRRLGVRWVSLAPRYVGRFEKGVDYIGDLAAFEAEFACHAAIARALGPYKLSLHSGSDKFSIYPIAARLAGELVHLKTAGTSYLEALRTVAAVDPVLFRDILAFAHARYAEDKATYHVSADPARVPQAETLANGALPAVLDQFDGRQLLHVTFGSVLDRYGPRLKAVLDRHEEAHYAALEAHFYKHLAPFGQP